MARDRGDTEARIRTRVAQILVFLVSGDCDEGGRRRIAENLDRIAASEIPKVPEAGDGSPEDGRAA